MRRHERLPVLEVVIQVGPVDGYEDARLDVTLSSLLTARENGHDVRVTLCGADGPFPILRQDVFRSLDLSVVPAAASASVGTWADLSFAPMVRYPFYMVVASGFSFPWRVASTDLFAHGRAVAYVSDSSPDYPEIQRNAVFIAGVAAPNDIRLHEGPIIYATVLAERAQILLEAMHGPAMGVIGLSPGCGPYLYAAVNDDRFENWHCIRRSPRPALFRHVEPDLRGVGREQALDRLYAQMSGSA